MIIANIRDNNKKVELSRMLTIIIAGNFEVVNMCILYLWALCPLLTFLSKEQWCMPDPLTF